MNVGRIPSYIQIRAGVYYVRISVPPEIRKQLGKSELKRSLNTRSMSEAARLAPATIARFQRQIEAARKQCTPVHTAVSQIQFDQARAVATAYLVLSKADPSSKALLERMIGHAFFGGVSVATGCERTIDYVRKSIRYDEQRRKQSEAAWDTSRKRTKWRDEARLLYDQVMPAEPHLKTAPKIIDRMNELKRIRDSSPAQLLALVRQWRSEARKSGL